MDFVKEQEMRAKYQYWWATLLMRKLEIRYRLIEDLGAKAENEEEFKQALKKIEEEGDKRFAKIVEKLDELKDSELDLDDDRESAGLSKKIEDGFKQLDEIWQEGLSEIKGEHEKSKG